MIQEHILLMIKMIFSMRVAVNYRENSFAQPQVSNQVNVQ